MKKIILSIGFLVAMASFTGTEASNINVSINIGAQPAWGPVGYNYVEFYYFPDINIYYSVNQGLFHYPYRGRWISARYLPIAYRNYDLYGLYKVVLTDRNPWHYNKRHIHDYRHFKGNRSQIVIRNSHDNRYRDSRKNDVRWYKDNHRDNKNKGRDRDTYYWRDNDRDNRSRSAVTDRQREVNKDNRNKNIKKEDNRRSERVNTRNSAKYAEASYSENSRRSSDRKSNDRSKERSSSRNEKGRSSASGRR